MVIWEAEQEEPRGGAEAGCARSQARPVLASMVESARCVLCVTEKKEEEDDDDKAKMVFSRFDWSTMT